MTITQSAAGADAGRPDAVIAHLPDGLVRGLRRPDGTGAFLGIRYARAERFGRAVAESPWSHELDATEHGSICPQAPGLLESAMGAALPPMDEDCLSLGVFVPPSFVPSSAPDSTYPVLVWIHGGAYVNGSGSTPWYDGSSLARRGETIVVTVNYRLGVFGFWRDNNLGLLDQIEALRWVRRNISGLGGDPNNVTVFGESAGGSSVVALMASPEARGLFSKVWAMSPSIGQYRTAARADEIAGAYLATVGASNDAELADRSVDDLLAAQAAIMAENGRAFDYFSPTWPGAGLHDDIVAAAATHSVPLVVGTTRDENRLFSAFSPEAAQMTTDTMREHMNRLLPDHADRAIDVYRRHRPGETDAQLVMAAQTDEGFRQRAIRLAERRADHGHPTHLYWFTWASPAFGGALGSCHALDIPFTFHNLDRNGVEMFTGDGADREIVADALSSQLLSFAATGEVSWPEFDRDRRNAWRADVTPEVLADPEPEIRALWDAARPDL